MYPEKTIIQKDTCTPMFIIALFTIARTWKQLKCPSTEEWIKIYVVIYTMQYMQWNIQYSVVYTMEYYFAVKRNEIVSFAEMWMDPEAVVQSKVTQKNKYHRLTLTCGI